MKMFSAPTCSQDFDIGAIEGADGERAVEREFHVAGAGGFHAGGRNLLGEIGGGDDRLRQAHIVVRQEYELELVAHERIGIDHPRHVMRELDDQLGALA